MSEDGNAAAPAADFVSFDSAAEDMRIGIAKAGTETVKKEAARDAALTESLRAVWDKVQARDGEPTMPPVPESATEEQSLEMATQWAQLPKAERARAAAAHAEIQTLKDYGAAQGIEVKTAADVAALKQLMQTQGQGDKPKVSDIWKSGLGLDVKDDAEGIENVSKLIKHMQTNGAKGWREVMEHFGTNPLEMLTPHELQMLAAQAHGRPMPEDPDSIGYRAVVEAWGEGREDFTDLREDIAKLLQSDKYANEKSVLKALDRAYHDARRAKRKQQRGERHDALDDAVQDAARRVFG